MGHDETAVADDRLRVHGVDNLRVVDASIMPEIVSGNTNAPTLFLQALALTFSPQFPRTLKRHHPRPAGSPPNSLPDSALFAHFSFNRKISQPNTPNQFGAPHPFQTIDKSPPKKPLLPCLGPGLSSVQKHIKQLHARRNQYPFDYTKHPTTGSTTPVKNGATHKIFIDNSFVCLNIEARQKLASCDAMQHFYLFYREEHKNDGI